MVIMACPIAPEDINKLKMFIQFASTQPSILNLPQLKFFKDFVEQLGGKVPEGNFSHASAKAEATPEPSKTQPEPEPMKEESDPESDVELELLDTVIEGDADADSQEMGDEGKEPTEEEMDQASDLRSKAAQAYSNQEFEEAVNCYTEAILLNPKNSLFYAKRGQVFLKMKKPNAAIRDCNRALQLNPDSAAAYKFRGRAQRLLGKWEEAAKDLRQACKLDFDDEADEWLKEVTPNAKKIEQHKIKQERKKTEKELNERRERVKRAQEANRRAEEERAKQEESAGGDFGGMPADFMEAFNDPEVAAALQDVMTNPANIMKYQNNPKVMNLLKKISGGMGGMPGMGGMGGMPGMGGMGGMPGNGGMGGMPGMGGMGGFPGFGGAAPNNDTPKSDSKPKDYDDGLD